MGEEWRRGWHPENISAKHKDASILVVGGGPAGLEATLALGRRGYQVTLAEASRELGGRVLSESSLPGFQSWIRVRDYRSNLIQKMENVDIYLQNNLNASDIEDFNSDYVVIATGSKWRRDGVGTHQHLPIAIPPANNIFTADDVFSGAQITGEILIYDDEHYSMAGALAQRYLQAGHAVSYMTPAPMISQWTTMTDEQCFIQKGLLSLGIKTIFTQKIDQVNNGVLHGRCIYSDQIFPHSFENLILVTGRQANDQLFGKLNPNNTSRIGDCFVPSSIADAIYSGHKMARELGQDPDQIVPKRERPLIQLEHAGAVL
jgi:dimethylamine/trimethylamine dehydrogenase